jgi:Pyruvate/2-oxoacid:ferredoxin oxidoreductase gamma subunit
LVSYESLERALLDSVPKPTHELNRSALKLGAKLAQQALENRSKG